MSTHPDLTHYDPDTQSSVYAPQTHPIHPERNGIATAALVLGIVSAVLAFIPLIGILTWVTAPLAIIFGAMSLRSSRRAFAIAGVTLGGIAVAIALAWVGFFGWAMLNADYTPPPATNSQQGVSYDACMREHNVAPVARGGQPYGFEQGFWHGYCGGPAA